MTIELQMDNIWLKFEQFVRKINFKSLKEVRIGFYPG